MIVGFDHHIAAAGEHLGNVLRLMVEGVAFPRDGTQYEVFSHEGDDIGVLATADVSYAISFMKSRGRQVGKMKTCASHYNPAFSFAWEGWHWLDR